jgi:hypothetical protein
MSRLLRWSVWACLLILLAIACGAPLRSAALARTQRLARATSPQPLR